MCFGVCLANFYIFLCVFDICLNSGGQELLEVIVEIYFRWMFGTNENYLLKTSLIIFPDPYFIICFFFSLFFVPVDFFFVSPHARNELGFNPKVFGEGGHPGGRIFKLLSTVVFRRKMKNNPHPTYLYIYI